MPLSDEIIAYHRAQPDPDAEICAALAAEISRALPDAESKVWHGHPVWFLAGNPVVGYAVRKNDVQLLFWSGGSFDEPGLAPEGSFRAAQQRLRSIDDIDEPALRRWLEKSRTIQWDYKNIRRTRGRLEPIPPYTGGP
jgi:hypothetical protein